MFSKVKRPLEIERDSSPKRAKSRKGLLTCGIGTGNRNLSICNKQTQIRIRVRIYENLRVIYCKKSSFPGSERSRSSPTVWGILLATD